MLSVPRRNHYHVLILNVRSLCHHLNNNSLFGVNIIKVIDNPSKAILYVATTNGCTIRLCIHSANYCAIFIIKCPIISKIYIELAIILNSINEVNEKCIRSLKKKKI